MSLLTDLAASASRARTHRPWPRYNVELGEWERAIAELVAGEMTLMGLWGEADRVHMALGAGPALAVITLACPGGSYPAVGRLHPPAIRLERALHDLFGLVPEGLADPRPWLDHGAWDAPFPLGPGTAGREQAPYPFLPVKGEGLHQIGVGPVHAGIIEPGHFRFTANGETVVRLEARLGYTHKGVEALLAGSDIATGARLAGRISGDSTVAYALAFAMAVEAATKTEISGRAIWLRALMGELERVANHLGDVGAICNDAGFGLLQAHFGALREQVLRASETAFGHRLMRDAIVPGGTAGELYPRGSLAIAITAADIRKQLPRLIEVYDETASLQDRTVGTGRVTADLVRQYGAGGFVGRAAGRDFDARRDRCYLPYDQLRFEVPVLEAGDVDARVWIRLREIEQSLGLIAQIIELAPPGPIRVRLRDGEGTGEGMAIAEGFRGDVLAWVRLDAESRIARCHLRDPSWFQWPLLEAAIDGNIVADFPLCNKSFNCSYSGTDL